MNREGMFMSCHNAQQMKNNSTVGKPTFGQKYLLACSPDNLLPPQQNL